MQQEVKFGSIQNPYKEFTFTIPPSGMETLYYAHNYFRVLSQSGGTLEVRFGGSGSATEWTGAGLSFKIPEVIGFVVLRNTGVTPMTITVAVAIGEITDDRLNISGNVNIVTPPGTYLNTLARQAATNVNAQTSVSTAAVQLVTANANTKSVTIYAGTLDLYIGGANTVTTANGLFIPSGSYIVLDNNAGNVWGIRAAGTTNAGTFREVY